jgi:hypothetical protein
MSYRDDYMQYRSSQEYPRSGPPEPPSHSPASYRPRPNSPYMNERPLSAGYYDGAQSPAIINSNARLAEPSPPYHATESPQGTATIYVIDMFHTSDDSPTNLFPVSHWQELM